MNAFKKPLDEWTVEDAEAVLYEFPSWADAKLAECTDEYEHALYIVQVNRYDQAHNG